MDLAPALIEELNRLPISINKYRLKAGEGRTQTFGAVNRRGQPIDYSRQCWLRPKLYGLLLEFAQRHVTIPFTSITVNQNYRAEPHYDKGNVGESYLVAFGDYEGGELEIHEGPLKGLHDVRGLPIVTDFSKVLHSVKPFTGTRYSLVFYNARGASSLPAPSVLFLNGRYWFKRGDSICTGLDHPLKGRKKTSQTQPETEHL
jgi:hypothetical protein